MTRYKGLHCGTRCYKNNATWRLVWKLPQRSFFLKKVIRCYFFLENSCYVRWYAARLLQDLLRAWEKKLLDYHIALIFHLIKLGNHSERWVLGFAWRSGICLLLMLFIKIYYCKIYIQVLQILQILQIFNWFFIICNWYDLINK